MSETDIPPILSEVPQLPPRARWRWALHVFLLAGYVLGIGLAGALLRPHGDQPAMPTEMGSLMKLFVVEVGLFLVIVAVACVFSKAGKDELLLRWRGAWRPLAWGIAYSVILRIVIMLLITAIAVPIVLIKGKDAVENLRPKTEAVVNMEALKDPLYAALAMTVVSFVMAGFREELWRVGMLAGLAGLAPAIFSSRKGQYFAVAIAAVIFGLGHLPQGWGGVVITAALGVGLGWIIVRHQSIWEAVLAHGFFDATTFGALFLILRYFPDALKSALGASG